MPGFSHFNIPADDLPRAKAFYESLLGWTITPDTELENRSLQWHTIVAGEPGMGEMTSGGLFKRYMPGPIMNFVTVEDLDSIYSRVEGLGGRIAMPRTTIRHVGTVAMVLDTEGNLFGLLERE